MMAVETTGERMWKPRSIARPAKSRCCRRSLMRRVFRAGARGRARAAGKILGTAHGDEHGAMDLNANAPTSVPLVVLKDDSAK